MLGGGHVDRVRLQPLQRACRHNRKKRHDDSQPLVYLLYMYHGVMSNNPCGFSGNMGEKNPRKCPQAPLCGNAECTRGPVQNRCPISLRKTPCRTDSIHTNRESMFCSARRRITGVLCLSSLEAPSIFSAWASYLAASGNTGQLDSDIINGCIIFDGLAVYTICISTFKRDIGLMWDK